jgi:hypothetical protein
MAKKMNNDVNVLFERLIGAYKDKKSRVIRRKDGRLVSTDGWKLNRGRGGYKLVEVYDPSGEARDLFDGKWRKPSEFVKWANTNVRRREVINKIGVPNNMNNGVRKYRYYYAYDFLDAHDGTHSYGAVVVDTSSKNAERRLLKRLASYHRMNVWDFNLTLAKKLETSSGDRIGVKEIAS